jgi:hypothetical protein
MRTVKWCLMFGVVLAGVVIGYCRPSDDEDYAPPPAMLTSFDDDCCDEGCDCCKHQATGAGRFAEFGPEILNGRLPSPTHEEIKAIEAAGAEKDGRIVR